MTTTITLWLSGFLIGIGLKTIVDCFDKRDVVLSRMDEIESRLGDFEEDSEYQSERLDAIEKVEWLGTPTALTQDDIDRAKQLLTGDARVNSLGDGKISRLSPEQRFNPR